jgi:hypothetical protein
MQNENGLWDPATALGLRNFDHVLVIGNAAFIPWLTQLFAQTSDHLVSVRRPAEIETLLHEGYKFDRMILPKETVYSHDHLLRVAALGAQLICFPTDDGWSIDQSIEFYYPTARRWKFETTYGTVMVAEPVGASWRLLYS